MTDRVIISRLHLGQLAQVGSPGKVIFGFICIRFIVFPSVLQLLFQQDHIGLGLINVGLLGGGFQVVDPALSIAHHLSGVCHILKSLSPCQIGILMQGL